MPPDSDHPAQTVEKVNLTHEQQVAMRQLYATIALMLVATAAILANIRHITSPIVDRVYAERERNVVATLSAMYASPESSENAYDSLNQLHQNTLISSIALVGIDEKSREENYCQGSVIDVQSIPGGSAILFTTARHCLLTESWHHIDSFQLVDLNAAWHDVEIPISQKGTSAKLSEEIAFNLDGVAIIATSKKTPDELSNEGIIGMGLDNFSLNPSGDLTHIESLVMTGENFNLPIPVEADASQLTNSFSITTISALPSWSGVGGFDQSNGAYIGLLNANYYLKKNGDLWVRMSDTERQKIISTWKDYIAKTHQR